MLSVDLIQQALPPNAFTVVPVNTEPQTVVGGAELSTVAVATNAAGNSVVAWVGVTGDPGIIIFGSWPILAQRFNAAGEALGDVIEVAPIADGTYTSLHVAMADDGQFVVGWNWTNNQHLPTGPVVVPALQRFSAQGKAIGSHFAPSIGTLSDVAFMRDHGLVVASEVNSHVDYIPTYRQDPEQGPRVYLSYFPTSNTVTAEPIRVGLGIDAHLAVTPYDSTIVTWQGGAYGADGVVAQWFDIYGEPTGNRLTVSGTSTRTSGPDVVFSSNGNSVVTYEETLGGQQRLFAQRFNAAAEFLGPAIEVASAGPGDTLGKSAIAAAADGTFFVTWTVQTATSNNAFVRAFDPTGTPLAGAYLIDQWTDYMPLTSLAVGADDTLVVAWAAPNVPADPAVAQPLASITGSLFATSLPPSTARPINLTVRTQRLTFPQKLSVDLNGNAPGVDYKANFTPTDNLVLLSDRDQLALRGATQLASATVSIAGYQPGDELMVSLSNTSITSSFDNGVLTLSGVDSIENYRQALGTVWFRTTASRPVGSTVEVSFVINDAVRQSDPAVSRISIHEPGRSSVVGRYTFYNNSSYDDSNGGAGSGHDAAIAPDKSALLPGKTATPANYTSYTRGLNGISIDLAGQHGTIEADDFIFRVGNSNEPSHWAYAPQPDAVIVRPGAGVGGADRVELVWEDGAIKNTWLQVIALDNGDTGLAQPDIFFFGNLVGDTINEADDAAGRRRRHPDGDQPPARQFGWSAAAPLVDDASDFDRDGRISNRDVLVSHQRGACPPSAAGIDSRRRATRHRRCDHHRRADPAMYLPDPSALSRSTALTRRCPDRDVADRGGDCRLAARRRAGPFAHRPAGPAGQTPAMLMLEADDA